MQVKILPSAETRVREIWGYTCETWGIEQADSYVDQLYAAFRRLPEQKSIWRLFDRKKLPGLQYVRYRHHYIFFSQFSADTLAIISVLHENMDLPERLWEDAIW